jgi:Fic family protein
MTREAIQSELAALDARRAELEQLSADLDNGQLTAKQIERFPILSRAEAKAFINDGTTESLIAATLADESHAEGCQ